MSERTVTVRLRALISDYQKAMRTAAGDTQSFAKGVASNFKQLNKDIGDLGVAMTRRVTVPLAGLGLAAGKVALDFETAFDQMQTLAGVTADEIDGLQEAVFRLAKETGRGPQELADALYFAKSAGFDTATALDIVQKSAKGAAIGLGTTAVVTDAVTNALGAYGTANLTASQALDILTASAQVAKVEAKDIAPQLGRLLPTAQLLKVGFGDVAGALAYLSTKSGDASLSATQLDGVLRKLLNPSEQGRKVLAEAFGSAEKGITALKSAIASGGLPAALDLVKSKFGGNSDALAKLFDDIQAFQGAALLLEDSTHTLGAAFEATNGSAGFLEKQFAKLAGSDAQKLRKDFASLQVTLIQLGALLVPLAANFGAALAKIVGAFSALPHWMQETVIWLGILAAASGPALKAVAVVGNVLGPPLKLLRTEFQALRAEGMTTGRALASVGTIGAVGLGAAGVAIAGLSIIMNDYNKKKQRTIELTRTLTDDLKHETQAAIELSAQHIGEDIVSGSLGNKLRSAQVDITALIDAVRTGSPALSQAMKDTQVSIDEVVKGLNKAAIAGDPLARALLTVQAQANLTSTDFIKLIKLLDSQAGSYQAASNAAKNAAYVAKQVGTTTAGAGAGIASMGGNLDDLGYIASLTNDELKELLSTVAMIYGSAFDVADAERGFADSLEDIDNAGKSAGGSTRDLTGQQKELERATKSVTQAQEDLTAAEKALDDARKGATPREKQDASLDVRDAELGLKQAQRAVTDARKRLADERKKGKAGDPAGAQLDLTASLLAVERAQLRVKDAQAAQNKVMHEGEETSDSVKDAIKGVKDATDRLTDATDRQSDAEAQLRSEGATGGPVADRARQIRSTYDAMVGAGQRWIDKLIAQGRPTKEIITALDTQNLSAQHYIDTVGDPEGKLARFIDANDKLKKIFNDAEYSRNVREIAESYGVISAGGQIIDLGNSPTARARGGPTRAGQTYLIGERGPELWTAGADGYVTPNDKLGKISQVAELTRRVTTPFAAPGPLEGIAGRRVRGGPVDAGDTYVVGEHGVEAFTPTAVDITSPALATEHATKADTIAARRAHTAELRRAAVERHAMARAMRSVTGANSAVSTGPQHEAVTAGGSLEAIIASIGPLREASTSATATASSVEHYTIIVEPRLNGRVLAREVVKVSHRDGGLDLRTRKAS